MAKHEDRHDHPLERLIFFSDAVFAIAITLLVIELHPPQVTRSGDLAYLHGLARLIPNFIGFVISFFVIGAFWAGHHRAFALSKHWSDRLGFPNLQMLFAVAAMPFFTAMISESPDARVPVALYCGWLAITALLNLRLQGIVFAPPVVDPHADPARIGMIRRRGRSVLLGALTATLTALVAPYPALGLLALMTIWPWRLLLDALARRGAKAGKA